MQTTVADWITCDHQHAEAVQAIFNDAIANSTAIYDYQPRSLEAVETWIRNKKSANLPLIGAIDHHGDLLGFGTFGPFRTFPAYQFTVEHSIYVSPGARRLGIGAGLLSRLIAAATTGTYHTMIGVIDSQNEPSLSLHRKFGFQICGELRQVGFKFNRWLDVCLMQKILNEYTGASLG